LVLMDFRKLLGLRYRRKDWIKEEYTPFGRGQKKAVFMSIARYAHINRPIKGSYFEFGCHGGFTMRMAWDCFHHLFDWDYVAFDSFEGLPEIEEIDEMRIWEKGKLKTSTEDFSDLMRHHGIPSEKLKLIKGFYNNSLTEELKQDLQPKKAAVIYVDCDLYHSTVDVLKFARDFFQVGTILVFDDWFCFYGDPDRGERRAFREFCEANPALLFEEFVRNNEQMSFVCLGNEEERKQAGRKQTAPVS
jgi:O-methyltransferase